MLSPFELVQYSLETEEPLRDSQGLCIRARPGTGLGNLPRCAKGGELWASLWLEQATRSLEVADAQWWRLQSSARPCIPGLSAQVWGLPLSWSVLPSSFASTSSSAASLGVHLRCSLARSVEVPSSQGSSSRPEPFPRVCSPGGWQGHSGISLPITICVSPLSILVGLFLF